MQKAELITAIVTPFNDRDEIDYGVMQRLVDHLIAEGTDGFVVGATTGEGPTLSHPEKITLYTRFADMVHGRALVIANSGSNNTKETAAFTHEVGGIAGIDATLVVVPYYNKPDQNGMIAITQPLLQRRRSRSSFTTFQAAPVLICYQQPLRHWRKIP